MNQEQLTAATILQVYSTIGYDAVAVGPHDLSAGLSLLQKSKDAGFPWLSANINDENGRLLFADSIQKSVQGHSIVITALSNAPERAIPGVQMRGWGEVLPSLLQQIQKNHPGSFIILLSSLNNDENKKIAEKFPEISLIIGADKRLGNVSPALHNKTLITQTAKQGKYQGLLEVSFGNQRVWGKDSQKQLADLQNRLGSMNWQLRRLIKKSKTAAAPEKYAMTITRLEKEKEELSTQIVKLKQQAEEEKMAGSSYDQFTYRFLALKKNMPNDQPTQEIIKKLNKDIRELHKKKNEANQTKRKNVQISVPQNLIGSATCASCHELQGDFWKTTKHATAYETLLQEDKNLNLECLPCRVTMDIPGGKFDSLPKETLLSYPESLQSVGCESCHGGGKKHLRTPDRIKLVRVPGINICLTCHTDEHDDNFQYQSKLEKIACPAG